MYTLWFRQYLLATQIGVELLSNVYVEWSKGIARLAGMDSMPPISGRRLDDAWLDTVDPHLGPDRHHPHVVNCAASVYCRDGFNLGRATSSNASNWIPCIYEA